MSNSQNTTGISHTPGPWHFDQDIGEIRDQHEITIATTTTEGVPGLEANNALIAASPKLLAAVNAAIDYLSDQDDEESAELFQQLCDAAQEAEGSATAA